MDGYAVYYCKVPPAIPDMRMNDPIRSWSWEFFIKVEEYNQALAACKLLRGTGRGAQAVRLDPEAIELTGPRPAR